MRTTTRRMVALLLGAAVMVAGCSADDSDDGGAMSEADADAGIAPANGTVDAQEEGAGDAAAADADRAPDDTADDVVTFGQAATTGRQLARTATVTVEVADVAEAARTVTAAAVRAGGFVESADVQGGDFGSGRLTLRVPASALDATLEEVGTIGLRVVSSGIATDDLTDRLVDLRARIGNLQALETELQELLASVENSDAEAGELLTVYDRISGVRGEIELLQAQRAAAADRVALATIHVDLVARAVAPEEIEPTPETTLGRAWAATQDAFAAMFDAGIWLVVTILPILAVVVGLPLLLLWAVVRAVRARRRGDADRRRAPAPPTPPTGGRPDEAADVRSGSGPSDGPSAP